MCDISTLTGRETEETPDGWAQTAVGEIIENLRGRYGLGAVFDQADHEIREEIRSR